MRSAEAPLYVLHHPIVREAIHANGMTVDEVADPRNWRNGVDPYMTSAIRMDVPFLFLNRHEGQVEWQVGQPHLEYRKIRDACEFWMKIIRTDIPDSMMNGLIGERLSRLIEVPGADEVRIIRFTRAPNQKNNDENDIIVFITNGETQQ